MPETAGRAPLQTSSTTASLDPSNSSLRSSKEKPSARRTPIPRTLSPSSPGLLPGSADGIATTNLQGPRPWPSDGATSPQHSKAIPSPHKPNFRESRSASERERVKGGLLRCLLRRLETWLLDSGGFAEIVEQAGEIRP